MEYSKQQLIDGIKQGDLAAFEELYKQYYIYLCLIAEHIVRNPSDAEEIVSDVFVRLWNIRENIKITTSIKAYLVKAVHNTSLNYLERHKISDNLTDSLSNSNYELLAWDSDYPLGQLYEKEIMNILDHGINTLPDACREIFILSRNEGLTYYKIAGKLGISVNTVKTQMKIALARLHENLKDYLMILLFFIGI
ncbi:MAG: RNA polymerase sigma-70 factor [Bacteroidales bacterium]|jgi:RNA polymerase sigma-70 factor (ECF subfamily)|nr:RNA polymerase sigma-70 factor [Bacteroidales bacterium]